MRNFIDYYFEADFTPPYRIRVETQTGPKNKRGEIQIPTSQAGYETHFGKIKKIPIENWKKSVVGRTAELGENKYHIDEKLYKHLKTLTSVEEPKKVYTKKIKEKELLDLIYNDITEFNKFLNDNKNKIKDTNQYYWVNMSKLSDPKFPLSHWKKLDEIGNVNALGYAEPYSDKEVFDGVIRSSAVSNSIVEVSIPYKSEPTYNKIRCFYGTFENLLKHI